MFDFTPATSPTIYFIGVTTTKSSIMKVFPEWAKALGLKEAAIRGFDLVPHAPADQYRQVVDFIKNDPLSLGALVTTHKLDLYAACKDLFDYVDPHAEKLSEVSSLSKKNGRFCAHAKDPISSGLALENFIPKDFWRDHRGEVLLLGAGGSSLAMSLYFTQDKFRGNMPGKITIANRSQPRLDSAREVLSDLNPAVQFEYVLNPMPSGNDRLVNALPEYSLIVNATGLGKDAPGSPTTDAVDYPKNCLIWEINYRGDLIFMYQAQAQAQAQAKEKNLHVEDGWIYFIHGWTQVISEVFHIEIGAEKLQELSNIAKSFNK